MEQTPPPTPAPKETKMEHNAIWASLGLAWEMGYLIAVPALVFGIGGAYLDKEFHTSPLLVILGFLIAFTCSALFIAKRIRAIFQK